MSEINYFSRYFIGEIFKNVIVKHITLVYFEINLNI